MIYDREKQVDDKNLIYFLEGSWSVHSRSQAFTFIFIDL